MNEHDLRQIADTVRRRREQLGLSAREVARRAGIATGTITRLELCQIGTPQTDTLRAIADALDMPLTELLAGSSLLRSSDLPAFTPYLRTKYKGMPEAAVKEIEAHFRDIAKRHGINLGNGPHPGQDE
ncbi:helix-turn-helix transcriptional regulator [Sinomonas albida]|uniref:helix-turn-helix domain-containing protein n=1 Tax=Sinomonas albida TaxID=369942 RepID=UPI0030191EB0